MKPATLEQGMKVQKMISDKGTPDKQLQWMLESGALSDLLDANPDNFNREEFRKFLGLRPLNRPLLIPVGTTSIAATTDTFIARDRFVKNTKKNAPVNISYLSDNFSSWFLGKTEEPFTGLTLKYGTLSCYSLDTAIIAELGGEEKSETTLTEIFSLMAQQPNGEKGVLLNNGYANIFYIRDAKGVLCTVVVYWGGDGWYVSASALDVGGWDDDHQVFSCNS